MAFELVNHQIMRVFGGIEAEKNSSIQSLERFQKKLFDGMKKAQSGLKKMHQAMSLAKESLIELSDNCVNVCKEGKNSGLLISKLQYEINQMMQRIAEEAFSLNRKMEGKIENYLPNLKKLKEKYTESADNLEHYTKKFALLKKSVDKQTLTKISQDEHERYERNKQKLRKAEKDHDEMLLKITKRYVEFNNEGLKDVYFDFISIISTFTGSMIGVTNRINKKIHQCFGSKQIILAQQLCRSNPKENVLKDKQVESGQTSCDNKARWLNHLIEQQQITNYLKYILDKEMAKVEFSLKIQQFFAKKQTEKKLSNENFETFKNVYKDPKQVLDLQRVPSFGNEELLECSQDLLSVGERNSCRQHKNSLAQVDQIQAEILDIEQSPQLPKKTESSQVRKRNLQKFEKFIEDQKIRQFKPKITNNIQNQKKTHIPIASLRLPEKQQLTVQPQDFFSMGQKSPHSAGKNLHSKSREALAEKKELPMESQFKTRIEEKHSPALTNKKDTLFETFDFFAPRNQDSQLRSTTAGTKDKSNNFDLLDM